MRRRTLLSLALAASLVAACSGGSETSSEDATTTTTTEASTTTSEPTTTTTEPPASSTVTLIDAGAEPRRELRYAVEEGQTDPVTQRNEMSLVQDAGGQRQELTMPAAELDVDYRSADVTDDRFTVVGTYGDARITEGDPTVVAEMQRLLDQMRGTELVSEMTPRGEVLTSRIDGMGATGNPVFDQLTSSLVEQAASMSFPLPEEAVGVGARWEVATDVQLSGLPIEARFLVTLTAVDGDVADATVDATLSFVRGPVEIQGITAEVIDGEMTGTGTVRWDLAGGLVPRLTMEMAGTATIEAAGTRIVQQQTQRSAVTPRA